MAVNNDDKVDKLRRYARLIERQTGHAVRPYRADGYVNLMNKYGTQRDMSEAYRFQEEPIVSDDILTMFYEGNGLFTKIIDSPAEEAIKHGFELKDLNDEEITKFYTGALDELDWEETAMTCIKWARLFGGSIAVMLINDGRGLDEPLDWKNIRSIDDIRVYDRSLIQPDYSSMFQYRNDDPFRTRASRLGMPEYYDVFSKYGNFRVHDSRCLVFQNGILPENTTNSVYQLWGIPEYVRINKAIRDAEVAHGSAVKLLDRSIQAIYKMKGLSSELATEEGEDRVLRRLQTIDMARGMLNSITIDGEGEEYDFRTFQFSGVSEVIDTTCNYLSALTSIPQTILFGRSPAGMNATGQSDLENWYNYVERIQSRMVRKNLRYLLSVVFQAGVATGEVDEVPNIDIEFNPLWSLSDSEKAALEQQKASTQQVKAQTAQIYVGMQAIDPSEVRRKLADSDEFDVENMLDEIDEDELFSDIQDMTGETVQEETNPIPQEEGQGMKTVIGAHKALNTNAPIPTPQHDKTAKGEEVSNEGHDTDTSTNAPTAAPAATKLPQDMSESEKGKSKKASNTDSKTDNKYSVGVIVVKDGKILVGTRTKGLHIGTLGGPGGHIEYGETPEQAAMRETYEEFGIIPKELIRIGISEVEPDTHLQSIIFLCTDYKGKIKSNDGEMIKPTFLTMEQIEELEEELFKPFRDSIEIFNQELGVLHGKDDNEHTEDTQTNCAESSITDEEINSPEDECEPSNLGYRIKVPPKTAFKGNKDENGNKGWNVLSTDEMAFLLGINGKGYFKRKPIDLSTLSVIVKSSASNIDGGPGSGNKNHEGVQGQLGGSAPSDSKSEITRFETSNGKMKITSDLKIKASKSGKTYVTIKSGGEITGIYSFAGKGSDNNLVMSGVLKKQYGTEDTKGWGHLAGYATVIDNEGKEHQEEIHWFEHDNVGQVNFKVKKR